jgi:hypothetical protein
MKMRTIIDVEKENGHTTVIEMLLKMEQIKYEIDQQRKMRGYVC